MGRTARRTGKGCIHCDLKPANIFMRGTIHLRGCFAKKMFKLKQQEVCAAAFQYQIPSSFEVGKGWCLNHA